LGALEEAEVVMIRTIRRILVAVDLAASRDVAFDRALLLARGRNAELCLLHMHSARRVSRFGVVGDHFELERAHSERSRLRTLLRSAEEEGVQVRVISAEGDAARAITAHAHLVMAELIVIARDFGSSPLWRTTRVATTVGRSAHVPVLIVPSRRDAFVSKGTPFTKVVVAVDFTVASAVALRVATDFIMQGDGHGTLVHVVPYASPMVFSGSEAFGVIDDLRDQLAAAEQRLRRTIPAAAIPRVKPRVLAGVAGQGILDVAAEVDADLVVMGVPKRDRFDELIFGSTFRKAVRRSLRPILAVPVTAGAYPWKGDPSAYAVSADHLLTAA
jgi:nucleotide-binding universal stress UspA family protein